MFHRISTSLVHANEEIINMEAMVIDDNEAMHFDSPKLQLLITEFPTHHCFPPKYHGFRAVGRHIG
jgi:hypothetical protein